VIPVKVIVLENRAEYKCLNDHLQDVWEQIQRDGCNEDAWATVAPQSEQERLDDAPEHVECNEVFGANDIPDLGAISASDRLENSFCSVELLNQIAFENNECKTAADVRQWCLDEEQGKKPKPFRLFVSGGAGVRKSHLIKCVYNEASKILRVRSIPRFF